MQVATFAATRFSGSGREEGVDAVAVEEPLELRLHTPEDSRTLAVLMRTPGQERELWQGWLLAEGILPAQFQLELDDENPNIWHLHTPEHARLAGAARLGVSSSACGVCVTGSIERLTLRAPPPAWTVGPVSPGFLCSLPAQLQAQQPGFRATGGLHAAALFTATGKLLACAEDVGRHNAVDKVVGTTLARLPLTDCVLCVSSRAGFEIVQKAVMAGVAVVVSVGAPSSLAVETAQVFGLTLCSFTREGRTTVYSGAERVQSGAASLSGPLLPFPHDR